MPDFSVSVISTSPSVFLENLDNFRSGPIKRIHVDVMDGQFVPRLGMYPEFVAEIRNRTDLPIDIHLMTFKPEQFLTIFARAGATRIVPHFEATNHPHHLVAQIRELGMEAGIALNPHTRIESLEYLLPDIDAVTLMAINPGIIGHKIIGQTIKKLFETKSFLESRNFKGELEICLLYTSDAADE